MSTLSVVAGSGGSTELFGGAMAYRVEDQILPAEFPVPRPRSVRQVVVDRDGSCCRLCGSRIGDDPESWSRAPRLLNLTPGAPAGELPELGMVMACEPCAADVEAGQAGVGDCPGGEACPSTEHGARRYGILQRTLRLLYLENCELAKSFPLQGVSR